MNDKDVVSAADAVTPDASNDFLLTTDYSGTDSNGTSYDWYTTGPCTSNPWLRQTMPSGWNDKFQSNYVWGHSGCTHNIHYENTYYNQNVNGATIECGSIVTFCTNMGAMNKETSSEKWYR